MQPRLLSLSGPLRKSEFALTDSLAIGSARSNGICLDDPSVSPTHCRITREDGHYFLTDLGSAAGTFLNGIPIQRRELSPGDEISVGNSVFLFELEAVGASSRNSLQLDDTSLLGAPLHQLQAEEVLYLRPDVLEGIPQSSSVAHNLSALLRISTTIGSLRDADALQWQLLGMIFDVIPAERGAILTIDPETKAVASHVAWDRTLGPDRPVHVSQAVLQRVVEDRVYLLDKGVAGSEPVAGTQDSGSAGAAIHSLLCVPLSAAEQPFGVIYLDTSNPKSVFSDEHLQLLSAIAGIASIAIENARQFERIGNENRQLRAEVNLEHDMLGQGPRMREVYQFIERVAPTDATILIHGGKRHRQGAHRASHPQK